MGLLWADAGSLGQIVLQIGRGRQREIILHTGPLVRQPRLVHRRSQAAQGQGGVVDVLVLLIALLAGGRKTLDMKDYVQGNFYGLNDKGRGELVVDYSAMVQDLPEKKGEVSQKDAISAAFGDLADSIGNRALIESAVKCELDKSSGLSNGDKVTVNIQVNDDRCKELGIKSKKSRLRSLWKD